MALLHALGRSWPWKMAWRESRQRRGRLMLFASSMVLGIAALTMIEGFKKGVLQSMELQAKTLLGADLAIAGRVRFGPAEEALFARIGGQQSREEGFTSMARFPASGGTRLVQVHALDGDFPFYGEFETDPPNAAKNWRDSGGALIEESLHHQYSIGVGDSLQVGDFSTRVVGIVKRVPGEAASFATLAPRVFLRIRELKGSRSFSNASLARYKMYFRLPDGASADRWVKQLQPELDALRLGSTTVERRKEDLGRSLDHLSYFLSLIGCTAVLLGGIGVASAIQAHVKEKTDHVAMLRCLGAKASDTFAIYLGQSMILGALASAIGVMVGVIAQWGLQRVAVRWLPLKLEGSMDGGVAILAWVFGSAICVLFSALPMTSLSDISPLQALRVASGGARRLPNRGAVTVSLLLIGVFLGFVMTHATRWTQGAGFALGLLVAFSSLAGIGWALLRIARRGAPRSMPFSLRQGWSNLHRPQNRTLLLLLALGTGSFLLTTLYLTEQTLMAQLLLDRGSRQANTVLFDVQPDQRSGVESLLSSRQLPLIDGVPIVTMRLTRMKGKSVEELLVDTNRQVAKWALRREYRSTWRDGLAEGESLIAGQWPPQSRSIEGGVTPVSVEEGIARELGVGLGDELVFDVQGVSMPTRIVSLRRVEWRRMQPNFFVVFPAGSLEGAPTLYVLLTKTRSAAESAGLQRSVVEAFPNVIAIDLTLVLATLDDVLSKVGYALRFMALFTVGSGLLVLGGALMSSHHQRLRESVLLRTLGASASQVRWILITEYLSIGLLSALSSCGLALLASWGLAHFVFRVAFVWSFTGLWVSAASVMLLSLAAGMFSSRGILQQPPLVTLRQT